MAGQKDQGTNPPADAEKPKFLPLKKRTMGEDSSDDGDIIESSREDVKKPTLQEIQIKAYDSVLQAFALETSAISDKRNEVIEKLKNEWQIADETHISFEDKIQKNLLTLQQKEDSSVSDEKKMQMVPETPLTKPATPSSSFVPKAGKSWGTVNSESLIGKWVRIRLSDEGEFEEFIIKEYNAKEDMHRLVTADTNAMESDDRLGWIDLREISPEYIMWEGGEKPNFDAPNQSMSDQKRSSSITLIGDNFSGDLDSVSKESTAVPIKKRDFVEYIPNNSSLEALEFLQKQQLEFFQKQQLEFLQKQAYLNVLHAFYSESPAISSPRDLIVKDLMKEWNIDQKTHSAYLNSINVDPMIQQLRNVSLASAQNAKQKVTAAEKPKVNEVTSTGIPISLPEDLVLEVLARLPKRQYSQFSLVSKQFLKLLQPLVINKSRRCAGTDSIYISFGFYRIGAFNRRWFTLQRMDEDYGRNKTEKNRWASTNIDLPGVPDKRGREILTVGSDIYFICGSRYIRPIIWIFDTRTKQCRMGPYIQADLRVLSVGQVDNKIYVIGHARNDEYAPIRVQFFDVNTQTWDSAPDHEAQWYKWLMVANASTDTKVFVLRPRKDSFYYDTRDGSCYPIEMPSQCYISALSIPEFHQWWRTGVCVIDYVLFIYDSKFGLMWYDCEILPQFDLDLQKDCVAIGMAEYYRKMAFLRIEQLDDVNQIYCTMISLVRSERGFDGTAEPFQFLGTVPSDFELQDCLSVVR